MQLVRPLQQRADDLAVLLQPLDDNVRGGAQHHDEAALPQGSYIVIAQHRSAARGNHQAALTNQTLDNGRFLLPEVRLPIFGEDDGYLHAAPDFDFPVQVDEAPAQLPGQQLSHSGFSCAHETDQNNVFHLPFSSLPLLAG